MRRAPHESDGRATLAAILPAGREVAERASRVLNAADFGTAPLSASQLDDLAKLLRTVRVSAGDFPG